MTQIHSSRFAMQTARFAVYAATALAIGTAAPVVAQDDGNPDTAIANTPIIDKLAECTQIASESDRLACFDREVGELVGATEEGEVRIVETEDITKARRRLFGFSLPKVGLFGGDDDEDEVTELVSTITKVRQVGRGEWHFWIEEGDAQWRIKNTSIRARAPEVGDEVEFKPATMGTYWIRVNGRKGARGNRIG